MSEHYPPVGAQHRDPDQCTFTLWAPKAKNVELILGNGAIHPLLPSSEGYWSITLNDIVPGDRYQYSLDHRTPLPDPASRHQPDGVHGASAVVDPAYSWSDQEWKGLPLSEMIIYELHVGTFTYEGTFRGVISRLDHLAELGINAIELMPVAQFPGSRNWGYDGVYPFAVQNSYGGSFGLKELVNEAHKKGIAVILDVVYNHQGPEGNYFAEFAPYFTDRYKTFWGEAINFDDAFCDGVRQFYWQNAQMWLDEFHIDGLRLDAVHSIWDFSAYHFIEALSERVRTLEEIAKCKKVLIAEIDLNNPRYINPVSAGGYGMDGQWMDEFHHALHALVTGEVNGYYEDFGNVGHLAKSFRDSYVYTGEYSIHRKRHFGVQPENPYGQFVVFAQNHDQIGNRLAGDRIVHTVSAETLRLVATVVILSPHVPFLFMGEEYGEKRPFQYFVSHTNEELVMAVREGRKKEFAHFGWKDEIPDPQSEITFRDCILSWDLDQEEARSLFEHYKALIKFRKERAVYRNKERNSVRVLDVQDQSFAFEYQSPEDFLVLIFNFSNEPCRYMLETPRRLSVIHDSSRGIWYPRDPDVLEKGTRQVSMGPRSAVILGEI